MDPLRSNDPVRLGEWRLMGILGEGGFGTVFLAESGARKAAVKALKPEIANDGESRRNLAKEAKVLSTLTDPAIGRIIDSDLEGETAWIATEFINGPTLDSKVRHDGPLSEHAWFNLAATLFHALVTAHQFGIIHKDVKPSNIVLGETGTKLIDFGIAHVSGQMTRTMTIGGRVGSTPFSAPEHFTPKSYPAMDVFSAAVTLAYAGKGSSIWHGETELQLMRNINEDEPDLEGLKSNQIEFLLPLLNKNPSDRPDSKDALEMALKYLEQYSSDDPIQTFNSWAGRRRPVKKSLSGLSITLIGSAAFSLTLFAIYALTSHQSAQNSPVSSPAAVISPTNSATPSLSIGVSTSAAVISPTNSATPSLSIGVSTSADCEDAFVHNKNDINEKCLGPANSGDVRSMFYMGKNAEDNRKLTVAESWFLKAAAKDDVSSMGELAQIYLDTKQTTKYEIWVKKCADYDAKSTPGARCKLLYGIDLLRKNDARKGLLYLQDSVDYGNGAAATIIGYHFQNLQEKETALAWFVKAAELGDFTGLNNLILLSHKLGETELYLKWLKISADKGNGQHAWMLAMDYFDKEDYKNAKRYSQLGANAGDTNAMGILGIILYELDKDIPTAKIWLKRAASADDPKAINILGLISRVEDKNLQDALEWYKKSAALGDLEGGYWLGVVYAGGLNDGPAACSAFQAVVSKSDELKKLGTFNSISMTTWVTQAQEGIKQTC